MTVVETLLVFVGAPLAVFVLLALLTLVPGARKEGLRYKPGQPWEHAPVWYEPHPDHGPAAGSHDSEPKAIGSSVYTEPVRGSGGGDSHGASGSAGTHPPVPAGPLGGARGTW